MGFTPLLITTMTMTGTFRIRDDGDDDRDVELPIDFIRTSDAIAASCGMTLNDVKIKRRARKDAYTREIVPEKRRFRNQVSLGYEGKSAKLFYNGSVHVTGCASITDFLDVSTAISAFVTESTGLRMTLKTYDVRMINAGTVIIDADGFPAKFPPRTFSSEAARAGITVDFDSERHPAVKIQAFEDGDKVGTACIFQTGSMSIIGAKKPADVALVFERAVSALEACAHVRDPTAPKTMRTTTTKKTFDLSFGYPTASYSACTS